MYSPNVVECAPSLCCSAPHETGNSKYQKFSSPKAFEYFTRKMDLLRLVLCRQSVDGLERLPELLKSKEFRKVRSTVLDYKDPENLKCAATSAGEVSNCSDEYMNVKYIAARAIFLRDWQHFVELDIHPMTMDFWLAIESGIPEVQAKALCVLLSQAGNPGRTADEYPYNDLAVIPWNERLMKIIGSIAGAGHRSEVLTGFLDIKVGSQYSSFGYSNNRYVGHCQRLLNGEETLDEYSELTRLYNISFDPLLFTGTNRDVQRGDKYWQAQLCKHVMFSGYLTPFRDILEDAEKRSQEVEKVAVHYASYLALKIIAGTSNHLSSITVSPGDKIIISRRFQNRARKIVEDGDLVSLLPERIVGWYRMIAFGEAASDDMNLRLALGMPLLDTSNGVPIESSANMSSLQGISYWDPAGLYCQVSDTFGPQVNPQGLHNMMLPVLDGYRKGQIKDFKSSGEDAIRISQEPGPMYRSILSYLREETETWRI